MVGRNRRAWPANAERQPALRTGEQLTGRSGAKENKVGRSAGAEPAPMGARTVSGKTSSGRLLSLAAVRDGATTYARKQVRERHGRFPGGHCDGPTLCLFFEVLLPSPKT